MHLYEIAMEGKLLEEILTDSEGELTPETEERFDRLLREGPDKIEAAAVVVMGLETDAEICEREAKRLRERAQSLKSQAERLRRLMTVALDSAFQGKLRTPKFTVWTQSSPPFTGFDLAPDADIEAVRNESPEIVRAEFSLDKKKLLEMYRRGEVLPASIAVTENSGTRFCRIR